MDPLKRFCPNPDCPARGQIGQGNVTVHSRKQCRYRCNICKKTFSERDGTALFRLRSDPNVILLVLTLIAHGCPVSAIVAAFGFQLSPRSGSRRGRCGTGWRRPGAIAKPFTTGWWESPASWGRSKRTSCG